MICPACRATGCRRSRRRSLLDFAATIVGRVPWRCSRCQVRFYSSYKPLATRLSAHCKVCGNLDLKRIAPEHVDGFSAPLKRLLGLPAYRCIPCRNKFFSIRPMAKQFRHDDQLRIAS